MKDEEIQAAILETAYKVWKQKEVKPFVLFEKSKDWGVEEKELNRNLSYLVQKGWMEKVGYKAGHHLVRITDTGIDEYRRTHKDS